MKLQNKVTIVTGAASGIGRACALRLAAEGACVVVSDVNADGGAETVQLIEDAGGTARFVAADVTQAAQVEALVLQTLDAFGRLDAAVNNAGIGGDLRPTHLREEATWDRILDINLKGVWLCMKYEIPAMLANGGGSIVNMASAAGLMGLRSGSAYAASKHGVVGLTRSAALEYATKGLRINAVCPGFVDTQLVTEMGGGSPRLLEGILSTNPMHRLGTPEEVAAAVSWLCSEDASFVNGHTLSVDGGVAAM